MKALLFIISFIMSLQVFAGPQSPFGGVSGGGGNIICPKAPINPVHPDVAEEMVIRSHQVIEKYIADKRIAFQKNNLSAQQMEAFAPVFSNNQSIETVMKKVNVDVVDDSSCWDANNQPVDGSTIHDQEGSICISSYNIAHKAEAAEIPPQSAALILHEYSEVIGLSEEQAVRVQKAALKDLRGY